jgi:uncharacterized protein (TIGR01370 family)
LLASIAFISSQDLSAAEKQVRWVVYYGADAPFSVFEPFEIIVLEAEHHPSIHILKENGKTLLGYLSLGEVESYRSYFNAVKSQNLLLMENENWRGSFFVDMRNKQWTARVIEEVIPSILRRGFDGLFLDTLDNSIELERMDPIRYQGMTTAAVELVRSIRLHYPNIKIMMNRAYEVIPKLGEDLDMVLGESVFASYDFQTRTYELVNSQAYKEQVKLLQAARKKFPKLKIMTLDYWDSTDSKAISEIYSLQRNNGFSPYVSTIELDKVISEPK